MTPKIFLTLFAFTLVSSSLPTAAKAGLIQGDIIFAGRITLDSNNVNTANAVTSWINTRVEAGDGDFGSLPSNTPAAFSAPWQFAPSTPVLGFWTAGSFTFDLLTASILQQGNGFLSITGTGIVRSSDPAFDPTLGSFLFSTQNPRAGGTFSFSAAAEVPEPSLYMLLGVGVLLCGQRFLRRR